MLQPAPSSIHAAAWHKRDGVCSGGLLQLWFLSTASDSEADALRGDAAFSEHMSSPETIGIDSTFDQDSPRGILLEASRKVKLLEIEVFWALDEPASLIDTPFLCTSSASVWSPFVATAPFILSSTIGPYCRVLPCNSLSNHRQNMLLLCIRCCYKLPPRRHVPFRLRTIYGVEK